jgi:MaoC dehydratase-like protein
LHICHSLSFQAVEEAKTAASSPPHRHARCWDEIIPGAPRKTLPCTLTQEAIGLYCKAVGETNSLYLDEATAKAGAYGGLIAPPAIHILLMFALGRSCEATATDFRTGAPGPARTSVVACASKSYRRSFIDRGAPSVSIPSRRLVDAVSTGVQ